MTKTEKTLLSKGIRPTEMRLKIHKYLNRKTYAVSLNEMQKSLSLKAKKQTAKRTTFYRNLKTFFDKRLIHQINDGTGVAKFAISDKRLKVNTVQIYICIFIVPFAEKLFACRIEYRNKTCRTIINNDLNLVLKGYVKIVVKTIGGSIKLNPCAPGRFPPPYLT